MAPLAGVADAPWLCVESPIASLMALLAVHGCLFGELTGAAAVEKSLNVRS